MQLTIPPALEKQLKRAAQVRNVSPAVYALDALRRQVEQDDARAAIERLPGGAVIAVRKPKVPGATEAP